MVASNQVPQIGRLDDVRLVVASVLSGFRRVREIADRSGLNARRVSYGIKAAQTLGWLGVMDRQVFVTDSGKRLLATASGSPDERSEFRRSFEASPLQAIAPGLLAEVAPTQVDLAKNIVRETGLGYSTAYSRAGALLSWRPQMQPDSGAKPAGRRRSPDRPAFQQLSLPGVQLSEALVRDLFRDNPWWSREPNKKLPEMRRSFVATIHRQLKLRLAPVIVVRGPRQVGKTTAQLQVIDDLLARGVDPGRILRVQFDELPALVGLEEPILRITDWFQAQILKRSFNAAARAGQQAYLFFDEVQNLPDWSVQLKHLVDSSSLQALVTGSSALRIEAGRDSLAGRISTIEVGTLTLREIAEIRGLGALPVALPDNGLEPLSQRDFWVALRENGESNSRLRDRAFAAFSERGGYPLVHERAAVPWPEVAQMLNETVIRRVIQHDLRLGERGRKRDAPLLEELFRLACRYAGQCPSVDLLAREAQRALRGDVGPQRIRQYLDFLDRTLLLHVVPPLELRLRKQKGNGKLCLADHGLRKSWLQEDVPLAPEALVNSPQVDLAGRIAESVCGSYLSTLSGIELSHFPERKPEPEVDFVITAGARRIPIEVKYRRHIDPHADTEGLRSFLEKSAYNAPFGVLVTQTDLPPLPDARIVALPLSSVLLIR